MDVGKLLKLKDVSAWEDVLAYLNYLELEGSTEISHRGKTIINYDQNNFEKAHLLVKDVRKKAAESVKTGGGERALLLYKRCLLFDAPFEFDSAIRYAEFDREPAKRFYEPRRMVLIRIVKALEDLEYRRIKRLLVAMPPGTGKALANDTPILTRNGWKKHGDLRVGDEVIGLDGHFKKILAVHPKCQLDRLVEFSNGEKIQCHENHEWLVHDRARHENHNYIAETKRLEKRTLGSGGEEGHRGHRYVVQLPERPCIVGEEKQLPLDPYTLGVWLGDGTNKNPTICCAPKDTAVIDRIVRNGHPIRWQTVHKTTGVLYFNFNMRNALQTMGMCHSRKTCSKHIPEVYLTASIDQRLNLLAGLIDTDGCLVGDKYRFSTSEECLRDSVLDLLATFGWRAYVTKYEPKVSSSGIIARKPYYTIGFTPDLEIPCELERKRNHGGRPKRAIGFKSITKVEPKEGNCITVEGGMYLAGRTMIPTHNSTLAIMYLIWSAYRRPEQQILAASHNMEFLKGVYGEILRMIDPEGEYLWHEIFPKVELVGTSAKNLRIDLGSTKRFETIQFNAIGQGSAGKVRATNLVYADDLVSGIEEAMSIPAMEKLWAKYITDIRSRIIGDDCVELMIQTPWSIHDPISRLMQQYENDKDTKIIAIPALNGKGKTNFGYPNGLGYNTRQLKEIKESMDDATWRALYMMSPIEREGQLYSPDELQRYIDLPDREPDAVLAVCDTKEQGTDYLCMPVGYKYDNQLYIECIICDSSGVEVLEERVAQTVIEHKVTNLCIESNRGGTIFARSVAEKIKNKGGRCSITTKWNQTNKDTRIITRAGIVKSSFLFKDDKEANKEYRKAINFLCGYTQTGKNKHDDVPDAMAMMVDFIEESGIHKVKVSKRLF